MVTETGESDEKPKESSEGNLLLEVRKSFLVIFFLRVLTIYRWLLRLASPNPRSPKPRHFFLFNDVLVRKERMGVARL